MGNYLLDIDRWQRESWESETVNVGAQMENMNQESQFASSDRIPCKKYSAWFYLNNI